MRRRKRVESPAPPIKPVPPGSYASAVIILLTDGQRTTGPDSIQAAKMAAERGVRIYTVGVGTPEGKIIGFEGWSMRVRLDEETLKADRRHHARRVLLCRQRGRPEEGLPVAERQAGDRAQEDRGHRAVRRVAALLAVVSAALSLAWFHRIV